MRALEMLLYILICTNVRSSIVPEIFFLHFCAIATLTHLLRPISDRVSTGIAIADIDLSLVDSVRARMPIAKVPSALYLPYMHV